MQAMFVYILEFDIFKSKMSLVLELWTSHSKVFIKSIFPQYDLSNFFICNSLL